MQKCQKWPRMDFPTSDADFRPFINRDIQLISKKSVTNMPMPVRYIYRWLRTMTDRKVGQRLSCQFDLAWPLITLKVNKVTQTQPSFWVNHGTVPFKMNLGHDQFCPLFTYFWLEVKLKSVQCLTILTDKQKLITYIKRPNVCIHGCLYEANSHCAF